jgi:DNA-binding MarR family transcriptional regulator
VANTLVEKEMARRIIAATEKDHEHLTKEITQAARELSTATLLFHHGIANQLGLNPTDHKCAEIIGRKGVVTAGELAEITGLTTGAVTAVLDRLEQRGFVQREHDRTDRRRVLVRPVADPQRDQRIAALFEPLSQAWSVLCTDYQPEELMLILEFMERSRVVLEQEAHRLSETDAESTGRPH